MATKRRTPLDEETIDEKKQRRMFSIWVFALGGLEFLNFLIGPFGMPKGKTPSDYLFLLLLLFYLLWALRLRSSKNDIRAKSVFRAPEILIVVSLVLFLLSYMFASTANMSYAQRFALTNGSVRLAPDSTIQRLNSASRYLPLTVLAAWAFVRYRVRWKAMLVRFDGGSDGAGSMGGAGGVLRTWALPLTLLSALLYSLAFPSFVSLRGFGWLGYLCLVPLFLAVQQSRYAKAVFYGVSFGVLQTMVTNFWLGTFSLVSLQFITVVFFVEYLIFMVIMVWLMHRFRRFAFLILPVAWVGFDYLRSLGFLGYPWAMLGTSQYQLVPLIQIASVTGVWGVTFLVTLVNGVLGNLLLERIAAAARTETSSGRVPWARGWGILALERIWIPIAAAAALFAADLIGGTVAVHSLSARPADHTVRVALIQQNTDPHKNDYQDTFTTLKTLTDKALADNPDLIVWSETAFVPNIRRWSGMDPNQYPLAKLVNEFLAYQQQTHTWLLTGNDDYSVSSDQFGNETRDDYNAAVLFSPDGERLQTYHKIHLVPFTEYFPYKKQLPWMYTMLQSFDVYLWEPGTEHVVFRTPKLAFSTPICFEDSFPNDVRRFVLGGAQAIVNISNDYWSLSKVEGKQHYINSMFRAVENRRPLLRATASGLTAYVDPLGRLVSSVPYYRPEYLVADVEIHRQNESLYTRFGDWFPWLMLLIVAGAAGGYAVQLRGRAVAAREDAVKAAPVTRPRGPRSGGKKAKRKRGR